MSLKFGFGAKKNATLPSRKPAAKVSAFGQDDSDDDASNKLDDLSKPGKFSKKPKLPISQFGDLSAKRSHQKNLDKALEVDPSIYDYDAAYDAQKARDDARKAVEREKAEDGKAKYMGNLLAAAEVRKKDQLRAKEKLLQRERVAEGEEFADKDKFVTGAYKRQQEELRRLEEEEKRKEEREEEKKKKMGSQVFFRNFLNEQDGRYQDDAAATSEAQKQGLKGADSEAIKKTDVDIAKELNSKGASITLTDDGEIADKRQLLSAGLNVVAKPKPPPSPKPNASQSVASKQIREDKSLGKLSARERQSRMVETQMEQLLKRQADEEADELRKKEHTAKSQKTDATISSARERYLARKKAAEEAKSTPGKDA
ncbi:hypothetical protein BT63DRAFT_34944 [Microthyrium microscopicum]|uniref:Nuclear speckle splicing regulatory protein 1 N-terminal domain-containing protein n=1 Tax=Microthyrium microscopicum TaxID=703497 RepID=A0A6A6UV98_9PEZI|nr:hypothetical protein BT63DRAFT_34944 [Microthyrium microscopicum]